MRTDDVKILPGENAGGNSRSCLQAVIFPFLDWELIKKCHKSWFTVILESR